MENKQTAVEWLKEKFNENGVYLSPIYNQAFEQAKEMEKRQIIDAIVWFDDTDRTPSQIEISAEQYYNETFNKD